MNILIRLWLSADCPPGHCSVMHVKRIIFNSKGVERKIVCSQVSRGSEVIMASSKFC